ncbi:MULTISPECIES: nicotinamide-nucleotide amidase [Pantoea]|jgi:nicotinamide-nucleotide amidase|uniref:Nicotinamide-nucleotide amidase n=1 Tax=Candidatus Pantoea symbiotica TaxID=1884370 RepID=A0A1I4DTJ5_9GAMM|nr:MULTISPECIES: nicotinamide-nucleotide amidase [Pantoea]MRT24140.1 nicotinamide-nucleotide amidase [Enterobacteriaceae bacterium RIT697]KAJ9432085.1 nicotinamide-nucleotide amidase [Pantoea sp. YR343]UVC28508.1 nicotinamide-nucleotide amidase [Pantoea sp. SOD02]SFK95386.1 nicotinamide-nucleotide amidase [Pantoea symbiotica]SFV06066.1 nicotinamide-nucleotide amidase [Pantoea sp. YR525]
MNDEQLQQLSRRIGEQLKKRQATVTAAESCTGGWIAKVFTDISGSSAWFERGFVTYSNEAKQQMVGVQDTTLQQYGAVSEQTVREMATGAAKAAAAEYAIAVSGIAGPDGGTPDKPVGTVWFAIAGPEGRVLAQRQIFAGDRDAVRRQSVVWALQTLLDEFLIN